MRTRTVDAWKQDLRDAMRAAMRARDPDLVSALREMLGAIDNAEAVDASAAPAAGRTSEGAIAGAIAGLGAGEVARRSLTPADVEAIVEAEIAERRAAAAEYERLGRDDQAAVLRRQLDALVALRQSA